MEKLLFSYCSNLYFTPPLVTPFTFYLRIFTLFGLLRNSLLREVILFGAALAPVVRASDCSTGFFFLSEALRFNKALDKSDIRGPPDGVAFIDGFFGVFASLSFFVLNEQMESKRALPVDFFTDCVFGVSTLFLS